jgi:hypothetical protein
MGSHESCVQGLEIIGCPTREGSSEDAECHVGFGNYAVDLCVFMFKVAGDHYT